MKIIFLGTNGIMKEKSPPISLNIAILPDDKTQNLAIDMSQKVSQEVDSHFTLNTKTFLPHITVYQAHFPKSHIEKVKDGVLRALSDAEPFTIEMSGFSIAFGTFLFWNCVKTDTLSYLQKKIISQTNWLRNGLILPIFSNQTGLSNEDKNDIQDYGSLLIGPHYRPHITITRIRKEIDAAQAIQELGRKRTTSFQVNNLIIGYLGDHGTVNGIIETIPFK